jgi:cation:H+ antiporter
VFDFIGSIGIAIPMIVLMSWVVSVASDKLGDVLHVLGIKLKIPSTVRGATFDAIASSFPEFATAMIAVLVYKEFADVGIPTIAGSGIFNVLLIPMASILTFKGVLALKVDKENIYRDMFFYSLSIGVLGIAMFTGQLNYIVGILLILIYIGYLVCLNYQTKVYQAKLKESSISEDADDSDDEEFEDMNYTSMIFWIIVTMAAIWVSVDGIIVSASVVSEFFSIPKFITSVIIIAAATSIPDTLLSIKSAKRGDADGAISNAVGSNIFDICVCLGVPMIISGNAIPVSFSQNIGVMFFLVVSMLITAVILLKKSGVKKLDSLAMLAGYLVFLYYIIDTAFKSWS